MTILSPCETLERSKRSWTTDCNRSAASSLADAPRYLTLTTTTNAAKAAKITATAVVKFLRLASHAEQVYPGPRE